MGLFIMKRLIETIVVFESFLKKYILQSIAWLIETIVVFEYWTVSHLGYIKLWLIETIVVFELEYME